MREGGEGEGRSRGEENERGAGGEKGRGEGVRRGGMQHVPPFSSFVLFALSGASFKPHLLLTCSSASCSSSSIMEEA